MWAQHRHEQRQQQPEPAAEPEQPPAGDASVAPEQPLAEAVPQEPEICCICQQSMGPRADSLSGAVEALACAHVFHSECLDSYCQATGRNRLNCCPYKCNADAFVAVEEQQQVDAVEEAAEADEQLRGLADAERERARANMF